MEASAEEKLRILVTPASRLSLPTSNYHLHLRRTQKLKIAIKPVVLESRPFCSVVCRSRHLPVDSPSCGSEGCEADELNSPRPESESLATLGPEALVPHTLKVDSAQRLLWPSGAFYMGPLGPE